MNRQVSLSCCFVLLAVLSMSPVDAWFMNSFAGITSDIVKNPLESLSLFALKSYLLGHVNGRVTQYRQMAYNANRQYTQPQQDPAASTQYRQYTPQPQPDQAASTQYHQYVQPAQPAQIQSALFPTIQQDQTQYRQVQFAPTPTEQFYNVRAKRSVSRDETVNDNVKVLNENLEEDRQQFLEMAEKLDNNKCIPKFVCEVMAGERVTDNGQFEELVAKVFGDEAPETKGDQKMFSSVYHFAAFSGKGSTGNGDYCRQLFPKCKASESEFKKIADKIFTGVEEDNETADDELIEAISRM